MKQQTYEHKLGLIVLIFVMMVSLLLPASAENHWNNVITEIFVSTTGETPSVDQWQQFQINAKFALPNGQVKEGDKTILTLPAQLAFAQELNFTIPAPDGSVVANAHVDPATKTLTITYTDYPEHNSNVTGEFFIYSYVDYTVVTEEQDVPITITMEDGTVITDGTVHYNGPTPPPPASVMRKFGWVMDDLHDLYHPIHINQTGVQINNAVLVDELQEPAPGVTYKRDTLTVKKGTWELVNGEWKLTNATTISNPDITYGTTADGRETFTLRLGDIAPEDGYIVSYQTRIDYMPADGEAFRNKATLSGDGLTTIDEEKVITVQIAGGSALGYVCKIKILKEDKTNQNPLAGVKFNVIRVASGQVVGTIETGADGTGELGNLLYDQYRLEEVVSPEGYLLTDPVTVEIEDFDTSYIAFKTIGNTPNEKISIPVEKRWLGPKDTAVVHLLANGEDTGKKLTLNAENNWSDSFTDLWKYDSNGLVIVYTVTEEAIENYTTAIEQNNENDITAGFTITNTNTETVDVPVTKRWVGPVAGPVTVQLKADDMAVPGKTLTLNADNNWSDNFTDLPKYAADGQEIVYTVEETNPPTGYTTSIAPNPTGGFIITNTMPTGDWTPTATKALTGRILADDEFEFELKEGGVVVQTVKNKADGSIPFAAISYTLADVGEHTYTITEKSGTLAGMTYDDLTVTYVVNVTDKGDGTLETTVTTTPADTEFNNEYKASGSWVPVVTKVLAGRTLEDDEFEFELKEGGVVVQTVKNKADGSIPFAAISYTLDDVGEHTYTITEKSGTLAGMTYDDLTVTYVVNVTDKGDGTLEATATTAPSDTEFNNEYKASGSWVPVVTKVLTGRTLEDDEFEFELKEGGVVVQTVKNKADGSIPFAVISYTLDDVGEHTYTITEKSGILAGMTYDNMTKSFTVMVSDNGDGTLKAEVTSAPVDTEFNNRYTPPQTPPPSTPSYDPISVPLSASKKLVNGALKEGQFAFQLLSGDKKVIETVSNDASGQIHFTDRRFSKTGTFVYTIREVKGDNAKITYDSTVYRVIIKTTASGGKLSASVNYEKDGTPYGGDIKFVNRIEMPKTGDSYLLLPLYLTILSLIIFGGVMLLRRKQEYKK